MVVDELIAKLGFKTEGVDKLKSAAAQYKKLQNDLKNVSPFKTAAAAQLVSGAAAQKFGAGQVVAAAGTSNLAIAARGLVAGFAGVSFAILGATAALGGFVALSARAGANAAILRRNMQLDATAKGTTAKNVDTLKSFWQVGGKIGGEKAGKLNSELIDSVASKLQAAKEGDKGAVDAFANRKIAVQNKDKTFRDTGAVALDAVRSFVDGRAAVEKLRSKKQFATAAAKEQQNAKFAKDAGITPEMQAVLAQFKSAADAMTALKVAGSMNPGKGDIDEAQSKRVAEKYSEIGAKVEAVSTAIGALVDKFNIGIAEKIAPALNSLLDGIISFGKRSGLIRETAAEYDARTEAERETTRGDARAKARMNSASAIAEEDEIIRRRSKQKIADDAAAEKARRAMASGTDREGRIARERTKPADGGKGGFLDGLQNFIRSLNPISEANGKTIATLEGINTTLGSVRDVLSPAKQADKIVGDKRAANETTNEYDNRQFTDIGNDHRTISTNITVNATGLNQIGSKVAGAIAPILAKSANTSTAAVDAA